MIQFLRFSSRSVINVSWSLQHIIISILLMKFTTLFQTASMACKELSKASSEEVQAFFKSFDTVLLDCDGVLWRGPNSIPGEQTWNFGSFRLSWIWTWFYRMSGNGAQISSDGQESHLRNEQCNEEPKRVRDQMWGSGIWRQIRKWQSYRKCFLKSRESRERKERKTTLMTMQLDIKNINHLRKPSRFNGFCILIRCMAFGPGVWKTMYALVN